MRSAERIMRRSARRLNLMFPAALLLLGSNGPLPGTEFSAASVQPQQAHFAAIDTAVEDAISRQQLPGAVVLVVHRGDIVFRKVYGLRSKAPKETPMTVDTVFDLASLTKPIATATSLMILSERGNLKFTDRVAQYLPAFGQNGKENITIEQLMLHTSGLLADNPVADYQDG